MNKIIQVRKFQLLYIIPWLKLAVVYYLSRHGKIMHKICTSKHFDIFGDIFPWVLWHRISQEHFHIFPWWWPKIKMFFGSESTNENPWLVATDQSQIQKQHHAMDILIGTWHLGTYYWKTVKVTINQDLLWVGPRNILGQQIFLFSW